MSPVGYCSDFLQINGNNSFNSSSSPVDQQGKTLNFSDILQLDGNLSINSSFSSPLPHGGDVSDMLQLDGNMSLNSSLSNDTPSKESKPVKKGYFNKNAIIANHLPASRFAICSLFPPKFAISKMISWSVISILVYYVKSGIRKRTRSIVK